MDCYGHGNNKIHDTTCLFVDLYISVVFTANLNMLKQ